MPKTTLHVNIPNPKTPNFSHPIPPSPTSTISAHTAESPRTISIAFDRLGSGYYQISSDAEEDVLARLYPTRTDSVYSRTRILIDDFVALEKYAEVKLETPPKNRKRRLSRGSSPGPDQDDVRSENLSTDGDEQDARGSGPISPLPCPFHNDPLCNKVLSDHEEQRTGICRACIHAMTPEFVLDTSPSLGPFTPTSLLVSPARALWLTRFSEVSIPPRKSSLNSIVEVHDSRVNSAACPIRSEIIEEDSPTSILSKNLVADPRGTSMPVAKTIVREPRRGSLTGNGPNSVALIGELPVGFKAVAPTPTIDLPLLSPIAAKIDAIIDSYKLSALQWEEQELKRGHGQIKQQRIMKNTKKLASSQAPEQRAETNDENISDEAERKAKEAYHRHLERKLRDLGHSQKCHCKQCSRIGKLLALACI